MLVQIREVREDFVEYRVEYYLLAHSAGRDALPRLSGRRKSPVAHLDADPLRPPGGRRQLPGEDPLRNHAVCNADVNRHDRDPRPRRIDRGAARLRAWTLQVCS